MAKILPKYFATPEAWRGWLEKHHDSEQELWVGYYKKGSGRPSITWPESVDEALCFGWIDGIRKTIDAESYVIRFTPRRSGSIWSDVNTRRAGELIQEKRMHDSGVRAFGKRDPKKSGVYSFEQRKNAKLSADQEKLFKSNRAAWSFFQGQPPGYRKIVAFYVMSAKREETRARRLAAVIRDSAAGRRIGLLQRPGK